MLSEMSHAQIQHTIQLTLGGRLTAQEQAELEAHLKECVECRSYQAQMLALDSSLKRALHASREGMQSLDHQRSERIVRRVKMRILFKNNLNFALSGALLAVVLLVVLFAMHLITQPSPQPVFPSSTLVSPVPSQTSLPEPQVITPENAHEVTRQNFLGRGAINGIAWSPDGKQIAAATSSGIYLVDMTTLAEKQISTSLSTNVSFSHDGSLLASAENSVVRVIDVSSEKVLYELKGHTDEINSVAFSPVENIIASSSGDKTVKLWDANRGEELHTLAGHNQWLKSVSFSPDGKYLVSNAYEEPSRLWDVASGQELRKFNNGNVDLKFSPDGRTLASGYFGGTVATISLWDAASGEELSKLEGAPNFTNDHGTSGFVPMDVAYSPDGTILASKSLYTGIILWDISAREELRTIQPNEEDTYHILFSPDGKQLASASSKAIEVWNTATGELIHTISLGIDPQVIDTPINSLVFSPKGDILATGGEQGTVKLYSVPAGKLLGVLKPEIGFIHSIAFSPDGKILAAGGGRYNPNEGGIVLWDRQTQKSIWRNVDFPEVVNQVVFSPDGRELAAVYGVGWGGIPSVRVWSLTDPHYVDGIWLDYESQVLTPVTYNQEGVLLSLATTAETSELIPTSREPLKPSLWDVKNSRELSALDGDFGVVGRFDIIPLSVDFSPDGSYVALGAAVGERSDNSGLYLWNVGSGRQIFPLENNAGGEIRQRQFNSVDFSPDGRMIAATYFEDGVHILAVDTGELLAVLDVQYAKVVAFSPDGTLIATGSDADPVRLWSVPVDREAGK